MLMGIYIEDMMLPHEDVEPLHLELYADGTVLFMKAPDDFYEFKAVPVPPHGRLGDLDAFKKRMMQGAIDAREDALTDEIWLRILDAAKSLCLDIDEQPTIIPAEEGQ